MPCRSFHTRGGLGVRCMKGWVGSGGGVGGCGKSRVFCVLHSYFVPINTVFVISVRHTT